MTDRFVHLHVHTEHSFLDGLGTIKDYVGRGVELGHPALAMTDHGNICGAPEFYKECRKAGIEPLIGEEFYFVPDVMAYKASKGKKLEGDNDTTRFHVVIIAKGFEGYKVLTELSTEAHRNFYYKPLIDRGIIENLGDATKHLVVLSGCAGSIVSRLIREGRHEEARQEMLWWRESFDNYYIELQDHSTDFDRELNAGLIDLARYGNVPWVVTNDPHYVFAEDECHHDTLLAIQTASDIDDPARFRFDGTGYHLRSRREMRRAFRKYGDEIWKPGARETLRIAKACRTRIPGWESRTWHIPRYKRGGGRDSLRLLAELVASGMERRGLHNKPEYVERAQHELEVIKEVGIADFLLITMDTIDWARSQGIPVGPGRGSVCGSLVGYLIGIHKIDPVKYNLLFERFLNPARPRMPDIDTDFGQRRRMELFTYVEEEYGIDNVVHVATYQRMKTKACFQQLARVHGFSHPDRIRISKMLDDDAEDANVPKEVTDRAPELVESLKRLAGAKRSIATHPAGVLIADERTKIHEMVPELWIPNTKRFVGQYDLYAAEHMGLMKQDFLGLRTLDTIEEAVNLIFQTTGEAIDPDSWVPDEEPDDDKVYAMLASGRTAGIFQMEGPTNQRGIRAIKCKEFEDIVSCTSLYRTGAISAGFPKIFLENRAAGSKDRVPLVHEALRPILGETWGVVLYQEQVMDIGRHLAGFDMVQVDDIKEAIKHKQGELMQSMKPLFLTGCLRTSGINYETAEEIWRMIEGYAGYGYNRSHAVAYSFTTYQTARLKALWPLEFFSALLRTVDTSSDTGKEKRDVYLREAVEMGYKILPPDINISGHGATPDPGSNAIRLGFTDYKGIKDAASNKIVKGRPAGGYETVEDVAKAVRNVGTMKILSEGSALESLGVKGTASKTEALLAWQFKDPMLKYRREYEGEITLPEDSVDGWVVLLGQIYKTDRSRKTKTGKPYVTWKIRYSTTQSYDIRLWQETERVWGLEPGSVVMIAGEWEPRWLNISVGSPKQIKVIKRVSKADTA